MLFGLLGLFLLVSAVRPRLQGMALIAGLISVLSFLAIASTTGDYNPSIGRVVTADIVALVALLIALVARRLQPSAPIEP